MGSEAKMPSRNMAIRYLIEKGLEAEHCQNRKEAQYGDSEETGQVKPRCRLGHHRLAGR